MTEPTPEQELREAANLEGWEPLDEVLLHSGLTVADLRAIFVKLDAARAKVLPCDGGCNVNDGPAEECSLHGRTPRDLWARLEKCTAALDAARATLDEAAAMARQPSAGRLDVLRIIEARR